MELIQIQNLNLSFQSNKHQIQILKNIELSIQKGEIVGLVGESGSGKSVTGKAILGLHDTKKTIVSGNILFHEKEKVIDLIRLNEPTFQKIRGKKISIIFQEPMSSFNPVKTCGSQVDEMSLLHLNYSNRQAKDYTLHLFDKVGLQNLQKSYSSYPHQLSGGQLQRIMIALAISCHPELIIADEPTTALDVTIQKKIIELLLKIRDENGVSILFISHDLGVIKMITDRVNVMYKGRIFEEGKTIETLNNPRHIYTKALIECKPSLIYNPPILPTMNDFVQIVQNEDDIQFLQKNKSQEIFKIEPKVNPPQVNKILEIKNLKVKYILNRNFWGKEKQSFLALNDICFNLHEGETLGVLGESGSGKSTLGRTIINLVKSQSGEIRFLDQTINHLPYHQWKPIYKQMQIIFQDPYASLNSKMTIGQAILEPMIVHKLHSNHSGRVKEMHRLCDRVGLTKTDALKYPHEFSGGQRQRVCIARAIAVNPKLIICDEAVSALDVSIQAQILNLLKEIQQENKISYLFITHDISVANFISHRLIVINKGEIVEHGNTNDIIQNPQTTYTKNLIHSIPKWST